jgi:hypothetical protein
MAHPRECLRVAAAGPCRAPGAALIHHATGKGIRVRALSFVGREEETQ